MERRNVLRIVMGTATQNGANGPLSKDRPKVYLCADCSNGNEFTKLALEIHKRKCTHQVSCACFVCSFKPSVKKCKKSTEPGSLISHLSVKIANLSKNHEAGELGNSANISEIQKMQSDLSNSVENSCSDHSHLNQIGKNCYVNSVSKIVSKSKYAEGRSAESLHSVRNYHDPCDRKIYCIICKIHVFWKSFGTHVLQHSIKTESSHLLCSVCSQSCLLPNYYLMHFFVHTSDHDCQECHCNNDKCPCYAQITTTCCYICLKSFGDMHAIIPHMMMHT